MSESDIPPCGSFPPFGPDGTPRPFADRWRTETVLALAHGIVADEAFDRLPIMADALEEAGCDDQLLLNHCRYCERHVPGCWAVELVRSPDQAEWMGELRTRVSEAVAEAALQGRPDAPEARAAKLHAKLERTVLFTARSGWLLILLLGIGAVAFQLGSMLWHVIFKS